MHTFSTPLLKWFDTFGRHNLPWQSQPANVYHVWLSEVMLQQTQVATVIDYFNRFIEAFPTILDLSKAKEDEVLALWAGLGYYARARNLHACAKLIMNQHQGQFPTTFEQVLALPGIGKSTAGAILSIGFNQQHAILDGNVKRVLARYHQVKGHYSQSKTLQELWRLSEQHTPNSRNAEYTQAIMDLGATLCTKSNPECMRCPIKKDCAAFASNTQAIYPEKKLTKTKPTRSTVMLIYQNTQGEIYLNKRKTTGIWGGLWSLPECKNNEEDIKNTIKDFCKKSQKYCHLTKIKHSFTHYHLIIHPLLVSCTTQKMGFFNISKLEVGIPAPVKKILAQLD